MELLTIPPPGWPKAVRYGDRVYRISRARRRWRDEFGNYYGQRRGVYYDSNSSRRYNRYIYIHLADAQANIAPEALPKWLRVSEGL